MYKLIIIIVGMILIIGLYMMKTYEYFPANYANDIYSIRPPYEMSKKYNPDKLGPFRILKYNFLNFPIPG